MERVIVGLSGGVDSAVAALLLKRAGYDVIGVTLRTLGSGEDGQESRCCEIDDAREIAGAIGIPYYPFNCISDFERLITKPFVEDYIRGLTPNPCIICNRLIKWEKMLYYAKVLKADKIATGHYAFVVKLDNGRYTVKRALHSEKDQTYMLYRLTQDQLASTLMPLGNLSKQEVRKIATEAGLPVASKPDSQEICFVTGKDYADYIENHAERPLPGEGNFVDENGNVLGRHKGIIHYTVGQRKGLGIALGHPAYVRKIDAAKNEIVLGSEDGRYCRSLICKDLNFLSIEGIESGDSLRCDVRVRYHHAGQSAVVENCGPGKARVTFDSPVKYAAPGQSAVFYDSDGCIIGGGFIEEVIYG
ncbi:MAG: tRNA 2-thiouridine(34) synthase MnmA [Clostridia bacterium]|nr:tRNA 2-thiouridine(34) synthase MnmA [Clostridia bacterium]